MTKRKLTNLACAAALALAAFPALYGEETAITSSSTMSWDTGLIDSVISLDARKAGITLPTGRGSALQMLEMETPTLLKDTYFSILVDSSKRLGDMIETGVISSDDLFRIIDAGKTAPPYFSLDLKTISMTHTVPVTEVAGIFVTHTKAYEPKAPLQGVPSRPFTGIIIDARGALPVHGEYTEDRLAPCLLPRIWNADMELVYEKNMEAPETAKANGIVAYTADTDESLYRDRIGTDPLRIVARELYGQYRTDPVISIADGKKILSNAENRTLLLQGKVVILCDRDALAYRNLGPVKDDNYYFTRQEIIGALEKRAVARIDFTSGWEGLKLTVYDIRFVADTDKILAEEKTRLDAIADALLLAGPQARFTVSGHTANVGKPAGELKLSQERAARIASELIKRGIARDRIDSAGFGSTRPIASNDTDEGRAKNRRVEITIDLATNRVH